MRTSETVSKIASALTLAQAKMGGAAKSATNPHFKSRYANLEAVIEAVKGPLLDNGIMFMQSPTNDSTGVQVTTRLQHESGEFIEDTIYLPIPQQTPQAYGSGITYAKRYALQSMCGIPSEDDDGQAASEPKKPVSAPIPANAEGKDIFDNLDAAGKDYLTGVADELAKMHKAGGSGEILAGYLTELKFDTDTKLALWHLLPSQIRSSIKGARPV